MGSKTFDRYRASDWPMELKLLELNEIEYSLASKKELVDVPRSVILRALFSRC